MLSKSCKSLFCGVSNKFTRKSQSINKFHCSAFVRRNQTDIQQTSATSNLRDENSKRNNFSPEAIAEYINTSMSKKNDVILPTDWKAKFEDPNYKPSFSHLTQVLDQNTAIENERRRHLVKPTTWEKMKTIFRVYVKTAIFVNSIALGYFYFGLKHGFVDPAAFGVDFVTHNFGSTDPFQSSLFKDLGGNMPPEMAERFKEFSELKKSQPPPSDNFAKAMVLKSLTETPRTVFIYLWTFIRYTHLQNLYEPIQIK